MTRLESVELECPCGNQFSVITYSSIFTLFDGGLIKNLLEGTLTTFKCEQCDKLLNLVTQILVNGPRGMVWISTNEKPETLRNILIELGVLNSSGEVRDFEDQYQEFQRRARDIQHSP